MFAQIHCLVLAALVTGVLCAPSPGRIRTGFYYGTEGAIGSVHDAKVKGALNGTLIDGTASGKAGASASGSVNAGVHVQYNDKIVEAEAEYHGSAGAVIKDTAKAQVGRGADGKYVLGGKGKPILSGEKSGAGAGGINTGQDALEKFNKYKERDVKHILIDMDDDDQW